MKDTLIDLFWMCVWIGGLLGWAIFLAGCSGLLQGEPIDLATVATPPVAQGPPTPSLLPPPPPPPDLSRAQFRAWVPREVLANGDAIEGHYLEVSPQAPAEEAIAPAVHVPRAPRQVVPKAPTGTKVRTLPAPLPEPAQPLQAVPYVSQPGVGVTIPLHGGMP